MKKWKRSYKYTKTKLLIQIMYDNVKVLYFFVKRGSMKIKGGNLYDV